jgi:glycolate oxidase FAD binding subunit
MTELMDNDITTELQTRVLAAIQSGTQLEIRGNGSKHFLGRRLAGEPLIVTPHAGIVNYQPRELVITARCGTSLSTIETALGEQGQMLPFEPPHFGPGATIGGTIACGLSGPARPYAGSARDLVLGTRVLTGLGQVLRFGGEVMKNVAGYDLSRLMTGAYGTLGLLLDVSLKVMPLQAAQRTLAQEQSQPEAIRLMNAWAGTALPITATCHDGNRLFVRLSGAETAVVQAAETIGGEAVRNQETLWRRQIREQGHDFFAAGSPLWRLSIPSATPPLDLPGIQLIEWGGALRWYRGELQSQAICRAASEAGGHATLFRGGDRSAEIFQPPAPPLMAIHRRLKQAFDPNGLFNPGRLFAEL